MKLFKSRFFLIAFLPNLLFVLLMIIQAFSTGRLADSENYAAVIFEEAGAFQTFFLIRNIFLLGYIAGAIYLIYEYLRSKGRNKKVLTRSFIIVGTGALISQFTFFLAALSYDILSMILLAF